MTETFPCGCDLLTGRRCRSAAAMWASANSVYRAQGYDAWVSALADYHEHLDERTGR